MGRNFFKTMNGDFDDFEQEDDTILDEIVKKEGPDMFIEMMLILSVALICVLLFIVYICLTKVEDIPKEYFMKNRIPLIKKVIQNKRDIKKAMKAKGEDI